MDIKNFIPYFVGTAESLNVSIALILTAILSAIFLKEKIGAVKLISLLICVPGAVLVIQPEFLFPPPEGHNMNTTTEDPLIITRWQTMQTPTNYSRWQDNNIPINSTRLNTKWGIPPYISNHNKAHSTHSQTNLDIGYRDATKEHGKILSDVNLYQSEQSKLTAIPENGYSNSILYHQNTILESLANNSNTTTMPTYVGYLLATAAGSCSPFAVLITRGTSIQNESVHTQIIWVWTSGLVISTVAMLIFQHPILPGTLRDWLLLSGHVIFSFLGTVTFYLAINLTSGVLVNLTNTTSVIISLLAQYFVLQGLRPGHQNVLEVLGSVLVFIAASLNSLVQLAKEKCKLTNCSKT